MADFSKPGTSFEPNQGLAPLPVDEITRFMQGIRRLPIFMPQRPIDAANWWMSMQKPQQRDERPRLVKVQGGQGSGQRWETPYINRVAHSFHKFVTLSAENQKFIVAAKEDGMWYNGDDMDFFFKLCDETQKMQEMGRKQYVSRCFEMMRKYIYGATPMA